jgi:hypothetical protein
MGLLFSFVGDETFWLAFTALVGAVLASVGLGGLSSEVVALIDAAAGVIVATYTASKAHKTATATKALASTTVANTTAQAAAAQAAAQAAANPTAAAPPAPVAGGPIPDAVAAVLTEVAKALAAHPDG